MIKNQQNQQTEILTSYIYSSKSTTGFLNDNLIYRNVYLNLLPHWNCR